MAKINSFSENIIEYLYHICHSAVIIRAYDIVGVLERLRRTVFRDESCFCRDEHFDIVISVAHGKSPVVRNAESVGEEKQTCALI